MNPNDFNPDMSELAKDMLEWESLKRSLDRLEASIKERVIALGKTQNVGNVRATYSGGRRSFDYETPGRAADPEIIKAFTETKIVETTAWKEICERAGIEPVIISTTPPSVTVKMV
jgi:hypothetical protein